MHNKKIALLKNELSGAATRMNFALHLAWSDTQARYRRSVLGPLWLVIGTLIGVGGLGFVWSALFEVDRATFIPSLSLGLVTWMFLSGSVVEAAAVFYGNRGLILNVPVSSLLVSILLLFRQVINFGHNFIVVILVMMIYPEHLSWTAVLFIPGFLLVCLNMLWIIQLIGYIGARYRDLAPLLAAIMQPLFFITPVLFRPSQLGTKAFITDFNPFTYLLSLIRDPLLGVVPSLFTWSVVLAMTVVGWVAALAMTVSKRHRLAYWVH